MGANYLIDFEKKALERYQWAIAKNERPENIVQYISECNESLFKSICIKDYEKKNNDPEITKPIPFLQNKNFFGRKEFINNKEEFIFKTPKLSSIKKNSEIINNKTNPKKHDSINVTEEEVLICIYAVKSILKWYFC